VSPSLSCTNHPDRLASARCPSCSRPICSECTIKIEGINVCTDCLKARARKEESRFSPRRSGGPLGSLVAVVAGFLGLTAIYFMYGLLLASIL